MNSNLNVQGDIQPLLRTKTNILSVCQNLTLQLLEARLNNHHPMSSNINHLNISSNKITAIPKIPFKNILHLNVSRCFLKDGCVVQLDQLLKLDLSHNCFTQIPKIGSLKLKFLNLSHNLIRQLKHCLTKYQQLQDLRCSDNPLNMFDINVLRMASCQNLDIIKIIQIDCLSQIKNGSYSARYLIQRSFSMITQQLLKKMLKQSLRRQYQIGISILCQSVKRKDQFQYISYCEQNNLHKSLETLLLVFKITEGYDVCRIESLNPKLFNYENSINLRTLLYTIEENIDKKGQICQTFIKHLINIGKPVITQNNLMQIISVTNSKVVYLLFKNHVDFLKDMDFKYQNPHLMKCLLQLDHPQLLLLLLQIQSFRKKMQIFLMTFSICSLIGPKYKIYKLLLKLQKQFVKDQISRKVCYFKQYESQPETSIYTSTPMYDCNQDQQMRSYYQMQDPEPAPAEVIVRMNSQRFQKQNQPTVTQQVQKIRHSFSNKNQKLGLTLRKINDN